MGKPEETRAWRGGKQQAVRGESIAHNQKQSIRHPNLKRISNHDCFKVKPTGVTLAH